MSVVKAKINDTDNQEFETIFVHFDTDNHYITLNEFMQTLNTYETITKNFTSDLMGIKSGVKIYVLPPKNGGFVISIGLWVASTAAAAIVGTTFSEEFKGLVKGLTKNSKKFPNGYEMGTGGEILGEMITGFVEQTSEEIDRLDKLIPNKKNIDISKKAKADFYAMCSKDSKIKGIGFSEKHEFILKRQDFVERATQPQVKPLPIKEELKELIVAKPVNIDEDLQWDFKDKNTKESLTAKMQDETFKAMHLMGKYPQKKASNPDIITARVEYHDNLKNGKESKDEYIITDVYMFNSIKLKTIPAHLKLNRKKKIDNGQLNLFENKEGIIEND